MARYRTYKNGIYGHRYKGLYIIKAEKGNFSVVDENSDIILESLHDYDDCEWAIDKELATEEELTIMQNLYSKEIFQLSSLFVELMQKREREGLDEKEKKLYAFVEKVRKRKADDRKF